jgi:hypothetical protein
MAIKTCNAKHLYLLGYHPRAGNRQVHACRTPSQLHCDAAVYKSSTQEDSPAPLDPLD